MIDHVGSWLAVLVEQLIAVVVVSRAGSPTHDRLRSRLRGYRGVRDHDDRYGCAGWLNDRSRRERWRRCVAVASGIVLASHGEAVLYLGL